MKIQTIQSCYHHHQSPLSSHIGNIVLKLAQASHTHPHCPLMYSARTHAMLLLPLQCECSSFYGFWDLPEVPYSAQSCLSSCLRHGHPGRPCLHKVHQNRHPPSRHKRQTISLAPAAQGYGFIAFADQPSHRSFMVNSLPTSLIRLQQGQGLKHELQAIAEDVDHPVRGTPSDV